MKKRILYVHHAGGMGGAPRSLAFLIQKLNKDKYEPIVLTISNGPVVELFEKAGAKVLIDETLFAFHGTTVSGMNPLLFLTNVLGACPTYLKAKQIIKNIRPDIIHLNTTCLFMFAKAAKDLPYNIKVITHVREPLLDSTSGNILKYMNHKYIDAYIPISKYDESKINIENRISEVVYNFVDFSTYNSTIKSNKLRKELEIENGSIIYLYLARIAPSNGTFELISMMEKIISKHGNYHLVIVGRNNSRDLYTSKILRMSRNSPNIHILDFRNDVPDVIVSSDIMVCSFTQPHFSRAIIEAAAMGIPSIATNIGGPNELVINMKTGILYELNNFKSFEKAIVMLGENEHLRKKMGECAEKFALENFNSEINVIKTFDLYDRLLMNKSD